MPMPSTISVFGGSFDVRKGNESVWRFHERFGARRIGETDLDYLYDLGLEDIFSATQRYQKYLPNSIEAELFT